MVRRVHPWHDLPAFADAKLHLLNAVIEIPKGSNVKYELDKRTGLLRVDRILYSSVIYPANYGFIPQTYCSDGDPLDVLVLNSEPVQSLSMLRVRAIGVLRMEDEGASDDKLVAVHADDPAFADYHSLDRLPQHVQRQTRRFFEEYKVLENKKVIVDDFLGATQAWEIIKEAIAMYQAKKTALLASD
jgi:inorganic pyrophosphatase